MHISSAEFFAAVLENIRNGRNEEAEQLLRQLKEPNETRLGLSKGSPKGRALGKESAHDVWNSLSTSYAAKTGLLRDLEDAILLVEGVSIDIISDMCTNILRAPLIEYTKNMCEHLEIPLQPGVVSGPLWNPKTKSWDQTYEQFPMPKGEKLLLVPKVIVRQEADYRLDEYLRHYILERMKEVELQANTSLVKVLKNGKRRVSKKDLVARYGSGKRLVIEQTERNPDLLEKYRTVKERRSSRPMSHHDISDAESSEYVDWGKLVSDVVQTPTGQKYFDVYEKMIEAFLTATFYPNLTNPYPQRKLNEGRKRVDITYTNMGHYGFFSWISKHYPSMNIFVECKNYASDVGNPEVDQLAGRFSPSRGQVGFLICRKFQDKDKIIQTCRDMALAKNGYILPLDDEDIASIGQERADGGRADFKLLRERFDNLIM